MTTTMRMLSTLMTARRSISTSSSTSRSSLVRSSSSSLRLLPATASFSTASSSTAQPSQSPNPQQQPAVDHPHEANQQGAQQQQPDHQQQQDQQQQDDQQHQEQQQQQEWDYDDLEEEPPQRRIRPWMIVLGSLVAVGGTLYFARDPIIAALVRWHRDELLSHPDEALKPEAWRFFPLLAATEAGRAAFAEPQLLHILSSLLLRPGTDPHARRVVGDVLALMVTAAGESPLDEIVIAMAKQPEVTQALHATALGGNKELSQLALMTLKSLLVHEPARTAFLAQHGLYNLSRASRATSPEVAGAAHEALSALLPFLTPKDYLRLPGPAHTSVFNALSNIGLIFSEQGLSAPAVQALRIAAELEPKHDVVVATLANELSKLGRYHEAIEYLQKTARAVPHSLDVVFHLHKLLYATRAERPAATVRTERDQCIKDLTRLLAEYQMPADASAMHPLISSAYSLLVRRLDEADEIPTAVNVAREWVRRVPTDAVSHFNYGRVLLKAKQFAAARRALEIAKMRDPSKIPTRYQLALCMYKQDQLEDAKKEAEEALQMSTTSASGADSTVSTSESSSSSASSSESPASSATMPGDVTVASSVSNLHLLLGTILSRTQRHTDALEHLQQYVSARPTASEGHMKLAECLQVLGRHTEAYQEFARTIECWNTELTERAMTRSAFFGSRAVAASALRSFGLVCAKPPANVPEIHDMCTHYKTLMQRK